MIYIANSLSSSMLPDDSYLITTTGVDYICSLVKMNGGVFDSAVGHSDTAAVFSELLGFHVPHKRQSISLKNGDIVIIGELSGPRLPEGATQLPPNTSIKWRLVQ